MNLPMPDRFTAAQIAAALGKDRKTICEALQGIPADKILVSGNLSDARPLSALPAAMQSALAALAARRGYRDAIHMLRDPDTIWQPPVPLAQCGQEAIAKAAKLQTLFLPFLQSSATETRSQSQIESALADASQSVFGYRRNRESLRRLLHRVIDRDRGRLEWHRLELFLDDKPGRKSSPSKPKADPDYDLSPLDDALNFCQDRTKPTAEDTEFLFDSAFRLAEELNQTHEGQAKPIRRAIIRWLFSAATLSKSKESLEKLYKLKYARWVQGGRKSAAIADRRGEKSGWYRRPDFTRDREKIRDAAILLEGNESLAHRQLRQSGELSKEFTDYFPYNIRRDKSRVPMREEITPEVDMCAAIHRGPHEAKMRGPYIQRDWSGVQPGDWFGADDRTPDAYSYKRLDNGEFWIGRGQWLPFIDNRSLRFLHHGFVVARQYNSEQIKLIKLQTMDIHGRPRLGFHFENGIWAAALNQERPTDDHLGFGHAQRILGKFGLTVRHANPGNPRSKPIERIFGIIQNLERNQPGYCGPNEQTHKMERLNEFMARCRAGKEHPGNELLEVSERVKLYDQTLAEYNAEPQRGNMLDGISPDEMWARRPTLEKLPEDARFFAATHSVETRVCTDGITITVRGQRRNYYCENTGHIVNKPVIAWYNVECPEVLTVSDPDCKNFFKAMHKSLPAMDATKEQFEEINSLRAAHMLPAKIIYGNIKHPERRFIVRDDAVSEDGKTLARFNTEAVETHRAEKAERAGKAAKLNRAAASAGMVLSQPVKNMDLAAEAIARLTAARRRAELEEKQP